VERILVIGGVAAGLSAASRARRLAPDARITVLERGPAAGYSACGLPLFLARRLARLEDLLAHPPEYFRDHRRLEVLLEHEALEIEPARRRVRVRHSGGEAWLGYDKLIVSTGARSRWRPERSAGGALRNLFAANTWAQAAALDAALASGELRRVAVVGAGYIGLETAEALALRGLRVTLIDAHADVLHGFDTSLAADLPASIAAVGIELRAAVRVLGLAGAGGGRVLGLTTSAGEIEADAVVNCAGLAPEVELAARAGLALGPTGAIAVDERQQTNCPGIYAAGDCAQSRHRVSGAPAWVPLATAANQQGRVAGATAVGHRARFSGILAALAVPLFGQEWGRVGLSECQALAAGLRPATVQVTAGSRAGYLQPDAVTLRLVYDQLTRRLLGCHVRGAPGTVAQRIDVAAIALAASLRLEDVASLDLAYAPGLAPLYEPLVVAAHNALSQA
jgi:NADPH-dependent 2,4-dienoyl-CoA reductase/sulfur reductase-like enzyme